MSVLEWYYGKQKFISSRDSNLFHNHMNTSPFMRALTIAMDYPGLDKFMLELDFVNHEKERENVKEAKIFIEQIGYQFIDITNRIADKSDDGKKIKMSLMTTIFDIEKTKHWGMCVAKLISALDESISDWIAIDFSKRVFFIHSIERAIPLTRENLNLCVQGMKGVLTFKRIFQVKLISEYKRNQFIENNQ